MKVECEQSPQKRPLGRKKKPNFGGEHLKFWTPYSSKMAAVDEKFFYACKRKQRRLPSKHCRENRQSRLAESEHVTRLVCHHWLTSVDSQ